MATRLLDEEEREKARGSPFPLMLFSAASLNQCLFGVTLSNYSINRVVFFRLRRGGRSLRNNMSTMGRSVPSSVSICSANPSLLEFLYFFLFYIKLIFFFSSLLIGIF